MNKLARYAVRNICAGERAELDYERACLAGTGPKSGNSVTLDEIAYHFRGAISGPESYRQPRRSDSCTLFLVEVSARLRVRGAERCLLPRSTRQDQWIGSARCAATSAPQSEHSKRKSIFACIQCTARRPHLHRLKSTQPGQMTAHLDLVMMSKGWHIGSLANKGSA